AVHCSFALQGRADRASLRLLVASSIRRGSSHELLHTDDGRAPMTYSMKPLRCDPARIKGMTERLIVSHYENNYGGRGETIEFDRGETRRTRLRECPGFSNQRLEA